jgi:hypothetical protein
MQHPNCTAAHIRTLPLQPRRIVHTRPAIFFAGFLAEPLLAPLPHLAILEAGAALPRL